MACQCSSCGAKVTWVRTAKGKMMPLDAEPVEKGNIVLRDGIAHYVGHQLELTDAPERYVSHFATCPNSAQHRKGK